MGGCAPKQRKPPVRLGKELRQVVKERAQTVTARVTGGMFHVEDTAGRPVLAARITKANALFQPGNPSEGPVTLGQADWTLYKDGKPSLWLKAPMATWEGGILKAVQGARCGSVDGTVFLQGRTVTWAARPSGDAPSLLTVSATHCELREPGQPPLLAEGPAATWQGGLLTLPSGGRAHAADRSASLRAKLVRWRAATHHLEATGRVRMTRGRLAGAAERLTGDTALRFFRLTGGRPWVTLYNQPAPLVAAAIPVSEGTSMVESHSKARLVGFRRAALLAPLALAALAVPAPSVEARNSFQLSTGVTVVADDISGDPANGVHAAGHVVLTGKQGILNANRVDVTPAPPSAPGAARSAVQVARASGDVRITSQLKPDERMEATGAAGSYWPGTQKATLTGGVTVKMTSPQLQEPAVMTGARADIDLAKRAVEVVRTPAAQVALRLRPQSATAPIRLDADRVLMENEANRVTATGSPVLTSDQGTVRAKRIAFDVDPQAKDVKTVHAEGEVQVDAQEPDKGRFQATARQGVLNRDTNIVVLTGDVKGTHTRPDEPTPDRFETDELTYNFKTQAYHARSLGERPSRATFRPKPKAQGAGTGLQGKTGQGPETAHH